MINAWTLKKMKTVIIYSYKTVKLVNQMAKNGLLQMYMMRLLPRAKQCFQLSSIVEIVLYDISIISIMFVDIGNMTLICKPNKDAH